MTTFPMACCRWNHSKLTDDTGCVSFEELQWVTGSIGPALVLFEAEGNSTYQLTMLVNADQPQPAELGFIYEQGLYDNFWYAVSPRAAEQCLSHSRACVWVWFYCRCRILFWALLMLLTCCLNKRCDLCGHLCSCFFLTLTFAAYYTMAFVLNWYVACTNTSLLAVDLSHVGGCGRFYVETISDSPYPVVGYMACVSPTRVSKCCRSHLRFVVTEPAASSRQPQLQRTGSLS